MAISYDNIQEYNQEIKSWGKDTRRALMMQLARLDLKDRDRVAQEIPLRKTVRMKYKRRYGEIVAASVTFARKGIFLERGVGRGVKISQVETSNRTPKPWLAVVMPGRVEKLADMVADEHAEDVSEEVKLVIPGIYDSRVR